MNLKILIGQRKWKEKRKRKILKENECLRNPWARNRSACTHITGVPEGRGKDRAERTLEEMMGGNFSNLMNTGI